MLSDDERKEMLAEGHIGALDDAQSSDLDLLAELLADESTWARPPTAIGDEIAELIAREAHPDVAPVTIDAARARRNERRRVAVPILAAVAAAAAVIVGLVVTRSSGPSTQFSARLEATGLAPSASGSASISRNNAGFRIDLDTHGLVPLPAGEFYQAWLKDSRGTLVPIGSFSSSDGHVTMWSGVSPNAFPTLTITIEAADGHQDSSGRKVLGGPVVGR